MKPVFYIIPLVIVSLIASGCRTSQGSKTYSRDDAMKVQEVYYGTVLNVAPVKIEAEQSGIGTVIGAVVGGVVGSTIGGGDGRKLATVGGAAAGAAAGSAAEKATGTKDAWELEVELDDGRIMVIVQEADDVFHVGDRVRVIQGKYGRYRVRH